MADGTTLDPGTGGDTIATDDITDLGVANGQKVQRIKLGFGADNAYTEVTSTTTNPFPVALSDTDNAVLDTIDAVLDTINAKLVTGTVIGDVNLGATDNAVLDSIDSAVNGTLTVGSHAVTNAGTFAVQISDTSFAVADGNALGEGVLIQGDDGTDRKNINVDATTGDVQVDVTNTVTVDGSAVTQPVSGTVTANLSATDNAVLDSIQAAVEVIDNPVVVDDAAFTPATTSVMMAGFEFDDTTPDSVDEGDAGAARMSSNRNVYTQIRDAAGNERGVNVNASNQLSVSVDNSPTLGANSGVDIGDVDVTSIVPGTAATSLGKAEDAAHTTGDTGVAILSRRIDTAAASGGTSGDYSTVNTDATGQLYSTPGASLGATGTTTYYDNDLDETKIAVDAGAVNIYSIQAFNTTAAPLFLQMFNVASASVTVGTTKPTNQYLIPGNADSDGAGFVINFGVPKSYGTAFTIACTTDSEGSTAPGAGACIVNIEYAT